MNKILLLSTSSSRNAGGLYNSVRNLGQKLVSMRLVNAKIFAFTDNYSPEDSKYYEPLPLEEYSIIGPPGIGFTIDLPSKIKEFSPDLIHIQGMWLFTSYINRKFCKRNKIPYIIAPRGMMDPWILSVRSWKKKLGLFLYEKNHLKSATCIHALCEPEYKAIRKFGCKNPIAIIPNGINMPDLTTEINEKELPAWKLDDDRKTILFLSRLHPKKNLENLIHAWSKINNFSDKWKLIIAGESKTEQYSNKLDKLIFDLGQGKNIELIGPQFHNDKHRTFILADAFILPSYSEGMPMAVLEAWSYALPALLTDECNIQEGFSENAAIRICQTPESILKGLIKLFSMSNAEMEKIGKNGWELVRRKYTWDAIALEMNEVYDWCIDSKKIKPASIKLN